MVLYSKILLLPIYYTISPVLLEFYLKCVIVYGDPVHQSQNSSPPPNLCRESEQNIEIKIKTEIQILKRKNKLNEEDMTKDKDERLDKKSQKQKQLPRTMYGLTTTELPQVTALTVSPDTVKETATYNTILNTFWIWFCSIFPHLGFILCSIESVLYY